jgi:hypothetical protein
MSFLDDGHFGYIKTSLFISLCILRFLPQQQITRELCSGGDCTIFLCSHVLMEHFLMGRIRKIQKHKEEGDKSGKFKKTRRK